jgi:hypothetical protein
MTNNDLNRSVVILFVTIILLIAGSLIPSGELAFGITIKQVDILSDVKEEVQAAEPGNNIEEELWDEDDDFFKDDEPAETDTLVQSAVGANK